MQWLAIVVALVGAGLIFISSLWGIGVSPDSAAYISSARELDSFADLFALPSHWAPGYPVLLAFASLLSDDILFTTRMLQCLLFAANLYLATRLMAVINQSYSPFMILAGAMFLVSFTTYSVHFYAWSEGPFILCQLLSTGCLLTYWQNHSQKLLLSAAAFAALALLFRYAGVAFIGTGGLALLLIGDGNLRQRFKQAVLYAVVALGPFVLWIVANHFIRNETTNRDFVVHLAGLADLRTLMFLFAGWLGAAQGPIVFMIETVLVAAVLYLAFKRSGSLPAPFRNFTIFSLIYIAGYTAFILFSKSFLDAYIPFDDRIFIPVFVFFFLLLTAAMARLLLHGNQQSKVIAAMALLFLLIGNALDVIPLINSNIQRGEGYLSEYTASLSKVDEVALLQGKTVYTNAPDYIRLMSTLQATDYPRKYDPTTQLLNANYLTDVNAMREAVQAQTAYLVHYQSFEWRAYFPGSAELASAGFEILLRGNGVMVMGFPAPVSEGEGTVTDAGAELPSETPRNP